MGFFLDIFLFQIFIIWFDFFQRETFYTRNFFQMIHVARVTPPPRFNYFVLILECNTSWGLIFSSDFLKWFLFFSTCDFFHHSLFIYTFFIFCQVRHDFFFFFLSFPQWSPPPRLLSPYFHMLISRVTHIFIWSHVWNFGAYHDEMQFHVFFKYYSRVVHLCGQIQGNGFFRGSSAV